MAAIAAACQRDVSTGPGRQNVAPVSPHASWGTPQFSESAVLGTPRHLESDATTQLAARLGVEIVHAFHYQDAVLVAYDGDAGALDRFRTDSMVMAVRPTVTSRNILSDLRHWGFLRTAQGHGFAEVSPTGAGVRVAILDTGIDCDHEDLATGGIYGTGCGTSRTFVPGDPNSPYEDPYPPYGHGTGVVGVIVAQANGSGLEGAASYGWFNSYRVIAADGSSSCNWVAAAVDQAMFDQIEIINISLGWPDTPYWRSQCTLLENAIAYAHAAGILVVAAAGNVAQAGADVAIPAVYEQAFAVSGVECGAYLWFGWLRCSSNAAFWEGSSRGPEVDIAAAADYLPILNAGSGYRWTSGTSFAAPMVSAAAMALVSTYEDARFQAQAIRAWLQEHAYGPSGQSGDPTLYGAGILDIATAVAAGSPCLSGGCYIHPSPW